MTLPWFKNLKLTPKSIPWLVAAFFMVFATVSLGVLISDVTRDDVLALHEGLDGTRFRQAEVGSFFEVSEDSVYGPLCSEWIEDGAPPIQKTVVVVNKLGETLPILTAGLGSFFLPDDEHANTVTHLVSWQITESAVASDVLWAYTRGVMGTTGGACRDTIDARTRSRDVRICPVDRVWKNEDGHTIAVFFDPYAMNGCRDGDPNCSDTCPRVIGGQVWTAIKLTLDLIEVGG